MTFDLIIQNGRVIDPSQGLDDVLDIGVADGKIAALGKDLMSSPEMQSLETQVLDASGNLVTPGLVDIHVHASEHVGGFNVPPDVVGVKMGVTTVVDAGSCGILGFPGFRKLVASSSKTRIYHQPNVYLLYQASADFITLKIGAVFAKENFSLNKAIRLFEENSDIIVGFKCIAATREPHDTESISLNYGKEISRATGLPLTVHLGWLPYYSWLDPRLVLNKLEAGDVATHVYRRVGHILNESGKVFPEALDARDRGVVFDIGHGTGDFDFEVAKRALDQGVKPDTISGDITNQSSVTGPVFSLTETMTKFLYLGLDLTEVIAMTTCNAARVINRSNELGSLLVGRDADISVLDYREGLWRLTDGIHHINWDGRKLIPKWTVRGGEIIPCEYPARSLRRQELAPA
ncbi:MAG: amidohydrolase family protein [Elainellaceae cyanobacterium]